MKPLPERTQRIRIIRSTAADQRTTGKDLDSQVAPEYPPRATVGGGVPLALVDLVELLDQGGGVTQPPDILTFNSATGLFYSARLNAVIGEPESGKSWLALAATAEVASSGGRVLYLDLEDTPDGILERLTALGLSRDELLRITYAKPDTKVQLQRLMGWATEEDFKLAIIDSFGGFLAMLRVDSMNNDAVARAQQEHLFRLSNSGTCVVLLDHVTKSQEGRGRYAIGAQAKLSGVSGANITARMVTPLGRGRTGEIALTAGKDRTGHLRQRTGVVTVSSSDSSVTMDFSWGEPSGEVVSRQAMLMERISSYLEDLGQPASKGQVEKAITGNSASKREAIRVLVQEGYLSEEERGQAKMLTLIRPYRSEIEEGFPL